MFVTPEIVSSEEEEINDDEEKFFLRIAKQNRPAKITNFFNELDKFANRAISKRGKFRSRNVLLGPQNLTIFNSVTNKKKLWQSWT